MALRSRLSGEGRYKSLCKFLLPRTLRSLFIYVTVIAALTWHGVELRKKEFIRRQLVGQEVSARSSVFLRQMWFRNDPILATDLSNRLRVWHRWLGARLAGQKTPLVFNSIEFGPVPETEIVQTLKLFPEVREVRITSDQLTGVVVGALEELGELRSVIFRDGKIPISAHEPVQLLSERVNFKLIDVVGTADLIRRFNRSKVRFDRSVFEKVRLDAVEMEYMNEFPNATHLRVHVDEANVDKLETLRGLESLTHLAISPIGVDSEQLSIICSLKNLKYLAIDCSKLNSQQLDQLKELSKLSTLHVLGDMSIDLDTQDFLNLNVDNLVLPDHYVTYLEMAALRSQPKAKISINKSLFRMFDNEEFHAMSPYLVFPPEW